MKMLQEEENMEQLAIFGGKPVREKKIFYGRQYIDQADVEAVTKDKRLKLLQHKIRQFQNKEKE